MQTAVVPVSEEFALSASPEQVWKILSDARAVVSCLPGAELTAEREGGLYEGAIAVKLGPSEVVFRGDVVQVLDAVARRGTLTAEGSDPRGRSRARAVLTFGVEAQSAGDGGARVGVEGTVEVFGVLASFAKTGGPHLARRMTADFAEELERRVERRDESGAENHPGPRRPVSGLRLLWLTVRDWFVDHLRRLRPRRRRTGSPG